MKQTTIYLPEEANRTLEQLAHQTGRSQTKLIREAIEHYLSRQRLPLPALWVWQQVVDLIWQSEMKNFCGKKYRRFTPSSSQR